MRQQNVFNFNQFNLERGWLLCNNNAKIYQKIYLYDDDDFADPFDDNDTDGWEYWNRLINL